MNKAFCPAFFRGEVCSMEKALITIEFSMYGSVHDHTWPTFL